MNLTKAQITEIANVVGLDYPSLMAFITVESGGSGFGVDGKIVIQFEPTWFDKFLTKAGVSHTFAKTIESGKLVYILRSGDKIITNGVEGQKNEWEAFNIAFSIHPNSAMLATSIGLMQIMGFNYASMSYKTVDEMWDDFKKGEYQQVLGGAKFIKNNASLYIALKGKDWAKVAYYYNGANYKVNNYDKKLADAYKRFL